jgi:ATP-dependent exoDNAse (exonuclease V) beta subunit
MTKTANTLPLFESNRPLIIRRASAGSGKTFALVKEYLRITLKNPESFRNVLAITFTNKATNELKERIIDELKKIIQYSENQGTKKPDILADDLTENDIKNAKNLLAVILKDYGDLKVSTIDSFFQQVLRSFAKELEMPSNFNIILKKDEIIEEVFIKLINKLDDEKILKILEGYITFQLDNEKSVNIKSDISRIINEIIDEKITTDLLNSLTGDKIYIIQNEIKFQILNINEEFDNLIDKIEEVMNLWETELDAAPKNYGSTNIFLSMIKRLHEKEFTYAASLEPENIMSENYWLKVKELKNPIYLNFLSEHVFPIVEEYLAIKEKIPLYNTYKSIIINLPILSLVKEINDLLNTYINETGKIFIKQTESKLSKHLENEPINFIYSKIGTRISNLMIDEFQDTSNSQWYNLKPLVEESVANGNTSLIIGDTKQSIYRFRNANPSLFAYGVEQDFRDYINLVKEESVNYRSLPEIITFNNSFFDILNTHKEHYFNLKIEESLHSSKIIDKINNFYGKELKQKVANKHKDDIGYVEVTLIESPRSAKEEFDNVFLSKIIDIIDSSIKLGYDFKDIAILVRDKKTAVLIINEIINVNAKRKDAEKISFISADYFKLTNNKEVRLILSALKYIYFGNNKLHKFEIINYFNDNNPNFSVDFEDLNALKYKVSSINDIINSILTLFFKEDTLNVYIDCLLQEALSYSLAEKGGIMDFINYLELQDLNVPQSKDINGVQFITIHKAKGLAFPIVIFANTGWDFYSQMQNDLKWISLNKDSIQNKNAEFLSQLPLYPINMVSKLFDSYFSEEFIDECEDKIIDGLNLLYVALTRAEFQLFVVSKLGKISDTKNDKDIISNLKTVEAMLAEFCEILTHDKIVEKEVENLGIDVVTYKIGKKSLAKKYQKRKESLVTLNDSSEIKEFKLDKFTPQNDNIEEYTKQNHIKSAIFKTKTENVRTAKDIWVTNYNFFNEIKELLDFLKKEGILNYEKKQKMPFPILGLIYADDEAIILDICTHRTKEVSLTNCLKAKEHFEEDFNKIEIKQFIY